MNGVASHINPTSRFFESVLFPSLYFNFDDRSLSRAFPVYRSKQQESPTSPIERCRSSLSTSSNPLSSRTAPDLPEYLFKSYRTPLLSTRPSRLLQNSPANPTHNLQDGTLQSSGSTPSPS